MKPYLCSTCGSTECVTYTYRGRGKEEIFRRCKPCSKAATEAWKKNSDSPLAVEYRKRQTIIRRKRLQKWYAGIRAQIFERFGAFCVCCGETEQIFLDIDHVMNDGAKERGFYMLRRIVALDFPKDRYQVLCRNCNWGKFRNGGICPHATKPEAAKSL